MGVTNALGRSAWGSLTQNRRVLRRAQRNFLRSVGPVRILEIGSGGWRRGYPFQSAIGLADPGADFVQSDLDPSRGHRIVDVTAPEPSLGLFDAVLCCNVLEHVFDIEAALQGLAQLVKPHGRILAATPFAYPLHDEPADYWRPTEHALEKLFAVHWRQVRIRPIGLRRLPFQIIVEASSLRVPEVLDIRLNKS